MRPYITAKFLRVGNHLINLELIQQLELRKDDSAVITVPGPRKSFRMIEVPAPAGRQLWEFFSENLVVIDFDHESLPSPKGKGDRKVKDAREEVAEKGSSKKKEASKAKIKVREETAPEPAPRKTRANKSAGKAPPPAEF